MRHDGKCSGLTLIELLVSISILTVLVSAILLALYSGVLVWERANGRDMHRMEAMIAMEGLEKEARNAFLFYGIGFQGSGASLKFPGLLTEDGDEGRVLRFCEIEYTYDSQTHAFLRTSRIYPFSNSGDEIRETVMSGVEAVRMTYADTPEKQGGSQVWVDSWNDRQRLPAALRIEFEFRESSGKVKITRTIGLPVRVGEEEEAGGGANDAA